MDGRVHRIRAANSSARARSGTSACPPTTPTWRKLAAHERRDRNDHVQREPGLRPLAGQRGCWTITSCRRPTTTRCDGIEPGARGAVQPRASEKGVGLTVMKGYAGGRLFSAEDVALRRGADAGAVHPLRAHAPGRGQHPGRRTTPWPTWTRPWPTRPPPRTRRTTRACWPARPAHAWLRPVHLLRPLRALHGGHRHRHCPTSSTTWPSWQGEVPASVRGALPARLDVSAPAPAWPARACEPRCPFGVPIAERMEKTEELFGCLNEPANFGVFRAFGRANATSTQKWPMEGASSGPKWLKMPVQP